MMMEINNDDDDAMTAVPSPEIPTYDMRFLNPSSFMLAGPSQSGKTTFALNLLRNIDTMFEKPSCRANVIYFYHAWQKQFKLFQQESIVHEWRNYLPTTKDIDDVTAGYLETGSIIVIDDFQEELNSDTVKIFTTQCHHRNCVLILLAQNIFCPKVGFRTISLNSTYIIMFKNPRDASQITCFAKQFSPGANSWLVKAYREATRNPHSYLLFDSHQATLEWMRVRSHMLPHELPIRLYVLEK